LATDKETRGELLEAYVEGHAKIFSLGGLSDLVGREIGGRSAKGLFGWSTTRPANWRLYSAWGKPLKCAEVARPKISPMLPGRWPKLISSACTYPRRPLGCIRSPEQKRRRTFCCQNIDPNLQDSSLVLYTLDWVLAQEFVRLYQHYSAQMEAQSIVESLVTRRGAPRTRFRWFLRS